MVARLVRAFRFAARTLEVHSKEEATIPPAAADLHKASRPNLLTFHGLHATCELSGNRFVSMIYVEVYVDVSLSCCPESLQMISIGNRRPRSQSTQRVEQLFGREGILEWCERGLKNVCGRLM